MNGNEPHMLSLVVVSPYRNNNPDSGRRRTLDSDLVVLASFLLQQKIPERLTRDEKVYFDSQLQRRLPCFPLYAETKHCCGDTWQKKKNGSPNDMTEGSKVCSLNMTFHKHLTSLY